MQDLELVGGKNASLGEMIQHLTKAGVKVPGGFATTSDAYQRFMAQDGLADKIYALLDGLDVNNVKQLAEVGSQARQWIMATPFQPAFEADIREAFQALQGSERYAVAVRSSATAEDLPTASFAGQQETFLNVNGIDEVLAAIKAVFASLFNDRAIAYRDHHDFDHRQVSLSAGIQRMVRSDQASSGVLFSIDTESGFDQVVFITASYGLGETVVQGAVNPDEFYVHKPTLAKGKNAILKKELGEKAIKMVYADSAGDVTQSVKTVSVAEESRRQFSISDQEICQLAEYAVAIEQHYGRPMDVEWAKDGIDGQLYILQARPETVKSREKNQVLERYQLKQKGEVLCSGRSIGQRIGQGAVRMIMQLDDMDQMQQGDVLVTDMTDPDWEPIMKRASAIVTNRGGRTCHAAIIARELGIPAVVGCNDATKQLTAGAEVTVSCAEGDTGYIYQGLLPFAVQRTEIDNMPELPFKLCMNVGNPDKAFSFASLPSQGVGLARLEFIISHMIGIHPNALLKLDDQPTNIANEIRNKIAAYASPIEFYIERLREGIATIAAAYYPKPVIVRLSDFKSNEYANLLGGDRYEPNEENPMIGFRGASRYISEDFQACFRLECQALKRVRDDMGLTNVEVMVPFVRTISEAEAVIELLASEGLKRGENGLRLIMMCEVPSNAILAEEFLNLFDGFSIGSNDLTQLTLGLDRDSSLVANIFDERNAAVKKLIHQAISTAKQQGKYIGICGQGPSDHPDFAQWLVEEGISAVSLNPDTVVETWLFLAEHLSQTKA